MQSVHISESCEICIATSAYLRVQKAANSMNRQPAESKNLQACALQYARDKRACPNFPNFPALQRKQIRLHEDIMRAMTDHAGNRDAMMTLQALQLRPEQKYRTAHESGESAPMLPRPCFSYGLEYFLQRYIPAQKRKEVSAP